MKLSNAFLGLVVFYPLGQAAAALSSQENAEQHLVRLSRDEIDGPATYEYDDSAGQGITVFVIDDGIRLSHNEFQGRASFGANFSAMIDERPYTGNHGTHVAALVGGATFGVAKKVKLVSVVSENEPSQIVQAVEWIVNQVKKDKLQGKAIISMSMHTDPPSNEVDAKFKHAFESGIVCVVSAGNFNTDAGRYSPGRIPEVITVAAMNQKMGTRWTQSSWGSAVDIYAPGQDIRSANPENDAAERTESGTSQATPLVAGLAAYLMSLESITEPAKVVARIKALATQSGARIPYNALNTTGLVATNGLHPSQNSSALVKKFPWTESLGFSFTCGTKGIRWAEDNCGTKKYCEAFDKEPRFQKGAYSEGAYAFEDHYANSTECFGAHEKEPPLDNDVETPLDNDVEPSLDNDARPPLTHVPDEDPIVFPTHRA